MKTQTKSNSLGSILVLLAFALLIVSLLMVLLTGADVVNRLTKRDEVNFDRRTAVSYITMRIHQSDCDGMLSVGTYCDGDALVITENIDGVSFQTLIYCYDGYLYELFCREGYAPDPEYGEKILPADSLSLSDMGAYIEVSVSVDGSDDTFQIMLRSREGGAQ
ncbi:MAG: DUF4860 domain-containing protein [Oscillospiraceae bacterium]|nr:DUF4860 domain-containing protein [Oscillospiraceae bacterium]